MPLWPGQFWTDFGFRVSTTCSINVAIWLLLTPGCARTPLFDAFSWLEHSTKLFKLQGRYSPVNERKIGEINRVVAIFCTVLGKCATNNILKVLTGGWSAGARGAFEVLLFRFFLNNSKTVASSQKVYIYKINLH